MLTNQLRHIVSPDGRDEPLVFRQCAKIFVGRLESDSETSYRLGTSRHAWLQTLSGEVVLNGEAQSARDGTAVSEEELW